jgi:hypothetical protein
MGEMANYTLDSGQDDDCLYDIGGGKTCRCCGVNNLHWVKRDDGKFVLADDLGIHCCPVNPLI